jgi:hypothetical protein
MAFINKIIGPDEKLIGIARLHWIYGAKGLLWLIGLLLFGGFVKMQISGLIDGRLSSIGSAVFWGSTVLGAVLFTFYAIMMFFTELGLTTQRVIYKRGLLLVDVKETDLEEIKSANIDNGILGRILNYGYIDLDARFVKDINFPAINDPYRFIKALNDARTSVKEDSLRMILDEPAGDVERAKRRKDYKKEPHHMEDHEYDAFSHNAEKNLEDWTKESHEAVGAHKTPEGNKKRHGKKPKGKAEKPQRSDTPDVFKSSKDNVTPFKPRKGDKKKLFVHEDALHDKVIDDFEEAEEPKKTKENAVEN